MRNILRYSWLILVFSFVLIYSCDKKAVPTLTTSSITNVTGTSATCGGTITDEGSGTIISRGVCWSTGTTPTIDNNKTTDGAGAGTYMSNITGLNGATTYYIRAYATNSAGTGYGMAMSFTTLGQKPTAYTQPATDITNSSVTLNGKVNPNHFSTIIVFEYGRSVAYGQSITASQSPISGNTDNTVSATLTGILSGTMYYYRIKAENSLGITYGEEMNFTTKTSPLSDIEGNNYRTVLIGTQIWMAENLRTTKYNDGTTIPLVTDATTWSNLITPGYCWYNNDETTFKDTYGALYNWYVVDFASNGGKNICPTGWHVPKTNEWETLVVFLGGFSIAGGKLKETGTSHWDSPNTGATNETNFTALPGGYRPVHGQGTYNMGTYGMWWSSSEYNTSDGVYRSIHSFNSWATWEAYNKKVGMSVRCIKDN